jgi:hypothetical protein
VDNLKTQICARDIESGLLATTPSPPPRVRVLPISSFLSPLSLASDQSPTSKRMGGQYLPSASTAKIRRGKRRQGKVTVFGRTRSSSESGTCAIDRSLPVPSPARPSLLLVRLSLGIVYAVSPPFDPIVHRLPHPRPCLLDRFGAPSPGGDEKEEEDDSSDDEGRPRLEEELEHVR